MKKIKFRAWDKKLKRMREVISINFFMEDVWLENIEEEVITRKFYQVELMQYIGLKDKNGKEIYEGDILLFTHNNRKWKCVVKFRGGGFVCEYPGDGLYNTFDAWNTKVMWEIVGNIYDNPILLRGEE